MQDSRDDAEENLDTDVVATSYNDLFIGGGAAYTCELYDKDGNCKRWSKEPVPFNSMVGLRFRNVAVPPKAVITNAYITFKAYTNGSGDASITIRGEDAGSPDAYSATNGDISDRSRTGSVSWNITNDWAAGASYSTPDLTSIVQGIVGRSDWNSGQSMAFMFSGSGSRSARSYDYGDGSSAPVLVIETDEDCSGVAASTQYYGYFDPNARYSYSSGFVRDPGGAWDGNWLNWVCMRKIDVTRKVLMGGLATARTGGGNQTLYGESSPGRAFLKEYDGSGVSPYDGHYYFGIADGYIYVDSDSYPYDGTKYTISVKKDINYEPQDFLDGNLSGVLQRVGDKAFWGNTWFDTGTGKDGSGGFIAAPVGTEMTSLVTDLQNTAADTWSPLAESV